MGQGWVYILVNSSIPNLVKVGCTTRPPAERATELSGATGVATPFIVAFEQEFADCVAAERAIHAELDRRGRRAAPNREFFRGPTSEIVRLILDLAVEPGADLAAKAAPATTELLSRGDRHLFGTGDVLQDLPEAVRCYRLAHARGSLVAIERLGTIYAGLRPSRANRRRTLRLLKEGARRGNYYCYAALASIFATDGHVENFTKAWDHFFACRAAAPLNEVELGGDRYPICLRLYIETCLRLGLRPGHLPELQAAADALLHTLVEALDQVRDSPEQRQRLAAVLRWTYENLLPTPRTLASQASCSWLRALWPPVNHVPA